MKYVMLERLAYAYSGQKKETRFCFNFATCIFLILCLFLFALLLLHVSLLQLLTYSFPLNPFVKYVCLDFLLSLWSIYSSCLKMWQKLAPFSRLFRFVYPWHIWCIVLMHDIVFLKCKGLKMSWLFSWGRKA